MISGTIAALRKMVVLIVMTVVHTVLSAKTKVLRAKTLMLWMKKAAMAASMRRFNSKIEKKWPRIDPRVTPAWNLTRL